MIKTQLRAFDQGKETMSNTHVHEINLAGSLGEQELRGRACLAPPVGNNPWSKGRRVSVHRPVPGLWMGSSRWCVVSMSTSVDEGQSK